MTDEEFKQWLRADSSIRVVLAEVQVSIDDVEETMMLSNRGYISEANFAYEACIVGGVSFTESLSLDGSASAGYGDIEIGNASGARDEWLDYVWANRPIRVWMGDARWPRADFRMIFDGVVGDIDGAGAGSGLTLSLLNKLDRLNNPAIEATLGGTGDNAERLVPHVLGEVHNIEPLLIDNNLGYRVHGGGAIERIIEVRDNGAPRPDVTPNTAGGTFRVTGNAVVGQITASVQGGLVGGIYANDVSNLVQRLATLYGPAVMRFAPAELDTANLNSFAAANPQPVGIYLNDNTSVLAAAQELAASVGAQVVCTTLGKLRLVKLALPAAGVPVTVTAADMESRSLHIAERPPVQATCRLGYCRNWQVQNSGMATGLPASSADLFAQEWLTATSTDPAVATKYRLTSTPEQEDTLLLTAPDAQAEADRRRDLWRAARTVYQADYYAHLLLTELGDPLTIEHARFGLAAGKTGVVVSIERDWLAGRVTLGVLI